VNTSAYEHNGERPRCRTLHGKIFWRAVRMIQKTLSRARSALTIEGLLPKQVSPLTLVSSQPSLVSECGPA